ncbi:MAG: adenine phosphoribosyltransferase [Bacteroidaceae bacterium]|nr:adenine phosphoribosyltransferase [Bacteroidaceae bacterium]
MNTDIDKIKQSIRDIYDFPVKGIVFKDLTTAFKNAKILNLISTNLTNLYKDKGITKVVGIESRGFIMGSILANNLGAGFVLVRKPGKLPADTIKESYKKEYGIDTVEIHADALDETDIVLIHDDLLATGGTVAAVLNMVKRFHPKKIYINFIAELEFLKGRDIFPEGTEIESLIKF